MANRKAAEEMILKWIKQIDPSLENYKMYKDDIFPSMTNEQFKNWMERIRDGKDYIFINAPNLTNKKINVANNLKIGKKMGVQFFQKLSQVDPTTGKRFTGTRKYLILHLPVRRQVQFISDKLKVQDGLGSRDALTGQIAQKSKGSKISFPESLVLYSQGLDKTITELVKARGGDEAAARALREEIIATGNASLTNVENMPSRAKSTDTLSTFLTAMHLKNNL